jgi:hypothetical protein
LGCPSSILADRLVAQCHQLPTIAQVCLGQLHRRQFQIEPVDEDEVRLGENGRIGRGRLERVRIRPVRDHAPQIDPVATDVPRDRGNRRHGRHDIQLAVVVDQLIIPAQRRRGRWRGRILRRHRPAPQSGQTAHGNAKPQHAATVEHEFGHLKHCPLR